MKLQPPAQRKLTGLLAAPVLDLCSMASVPSIWLPQVRLPAAFRLVDTSTPLETFAATHVPS